MATCDQAEWKCTAEEYHADCDRQSRSMAWLYRNDPQDYFEQFVSRTGTRRPPTPEMITGSLSHLFILEPERLKTDVAVYPRTVLSVSGARGTNAAKRFEEENAGKVVVKEDEFKLAQMIVDAVRCDSVVKRLRLLEGGQPERTIVWQDIETGLLCKCRFDYSKPRLLVDIKTTTDERPQAFSSTAANFGYDFQDAFYRLGEERAGGEPPQMVFIAVTKKPPIKVACHELDAEFRDVAERDVRNTLNALAKSIQFDDWLPEHRKQINEIKPPLWRVNSYRWEMQPNGSAG